MITVVNKRTHEPTPMDFYIGRGTPLGNPYTHVGNRQTLARFKTNTRKEALDKYDKWLLTQLMDPTSPQTKEIQRLTKFAMHNDIYLVCHCRPFRCEGDGIKTIIDNLIFPIRDED